MNKELLSEFIQELDSIYDKYPFVLVPVIIETKDNNGQVLSIKADIQITQKDNVDHNNILLDKSKDN